MTTRDQRETSTRPFGVPLAGPLETVPREVDRAEAQEMLRHVLRALEGGGVRLGKADEAALTWLQEQDDATVVVLASLIHRTLNAPAVALGSAGEGRLWALRVPADESEPGEVLSLQLSAAGLSDAIGGGLLEDVAYGQVNGTEFCIYCDEERVQKAAPPNGRVTVLAARLGLTQASTEVQWRGDALVVGIDGQQNDRDVPVGVLVAARLSGLPLGRIDNRGELTEG